MAGKKATSELGHLFGKNDIERVGLFSEMPYLNGKGYVSPFLKPRLEKGKSMVGEYPKTKTGKQDCYFDKDFKRIFEGEAIKGRGRKTPPSKFKNLSEKPFTSPGNTKPISTPGDYYGTFDKHVEAFSNKRRPKPAYKGEMRNFLTSPVKQGGYGYADVCLNPYPNHAAERYGTKPKYKEYGRRLGGPLVTSHYTKEYFEANPFAEPSNIKPGPTYVRPKDTSKPALGPGKIIPTGPGKTLGGCKAGCFDKFPEHKPNKYVTITDLTKPRRHVGGQFFPQCTAEKTFYTFSVVNENVRFRVNEMNRNNYASNYVKYLLN